MARPRRFGKSLFISTLKAILMGKRELFKGCAIDESDYEWKEYPVIHLDFSLVSSKDPDALESSLERTLVSFAEEADEKLIFHSAAEGLTTLIKQLAKKGKVVVLIDEYDKPIVDNFHSIEIAEKNRNILKSFFGVLKGLDDYLKFVFITGVSKFSQGSLFSGLNNLNDITVDSRYGAMMGYTEEEIRKCFSPYLEKVAKKRGETEGELMIEIQKWYNGYRFSHEGTSVYNPFSTLSFFDAEMFHSYWFRTGTPTFLIYQIQKHPMIVAELSGIDATASELLDIRELDRMDLKALMWQTGYLTIQNYNPKTKLYTLDFPNQEVREAFFESLLREYARLSPAIVMRHAIECKESLERGDLRKCEKIT